MLNKHKLAQEAERDRSLVTCAYVNKLGVNLSTCLLCTACVINDSLLHVLPESHMCQMMVLFFNMQHC